MLIFVVVVAVLSFHGALYPNYQRERDLELNLRPGKRFEEHLGSERGWQARHIKKRRRPSNRRALPGQKDRKGAMDGKSHVESSCTTGTLVNEGRSHVTQDPQLLWRVSQGAGSNTEAPLPDGESRIDGNLQHRDLALSTSQGFHKLTSTQILVDRGQGIHYSANRMHFIPRWMDVLQRW